MIESNVKNDLERKIDLYINGKLTTEEIDDLWSDLIQDDYYLDYTKTFANLKDLIESKRNESETTKPSRLRLVAGYASVAAVVALIALIGIINFSNNQNASFDALSNIPLDTYRSAEGVINEEMTDARIQEAIELANRGEVETALNMLNEELDNTNDDTRIAKIGLSLGAIQYNNGDYLSSIGSFELTVSQPDIEVLTLEKGYFYLGNAYFQVDLNNKARDAFLKAYNLNGQYRRVAKSYLDVMSLTD